MSFTNILLLAMSVTMAMGQRPSFAGTRPIGYPEVIKTTTDGLVNKFGEDDATTMRLPIEANGDRDLVDRLSKLPIDQQPFWFINWQAYEANRQKPQTYPQKPNVFAESANTNTGNTNFQNFAPSNNPPQNNQFNQGSFSQQTTRQPAGNSNSQLSNRNGDSSDSLVPTSTENARNTNQNFMTPTGNMEITSRIRPDEQYQIIDGVRYRVTHNHHHY